jgi:hypothetical protein
LHRVPLYLAIAAALLAPGCCLPQLSGRCEQPVVCQTPPSPVPGHGDRDGHRPREQRGLAFGSDDRDTPPGEVVPVPKFHPVPTRPVFEPLPEYGLPRSLRLPDAPRHAAPTDEPLPTPAQPAPDPA